MSQPPAIREEQSKALITQNQKMITSLFNGDKKAANKFMSIALRVAQDYSLQECSPATIIDASLGAAQLNLSIDRNLGQAYIIPYKTKSGYRVAQLQVGYKGYITLLDRAGWKVKCKAVYDCDKFEHEFDGWEERVLFKPNLDERREDDGVWAHKHIKLVFVAIKDPDGEVRYETVKRDLIEKVRMKSENQKNTKAPEYIWLEWFEDMAMKTALKRVIKKLPIGDEFQNIIAIDEASEKGKAIEVKRSIEEGTVIDIEAEQVTAPKKSTKVLLAEALIRGGIPQPSLKMFSDWAKLDDEKMEELLNDPAGLEALIEEFKTME